MKNIKFKKINFQKLMDNKTFVKLLSLIFAVLTWGIIVYSLYPTNTKEIKNVPISINMQDNRIKDLGLNIISGGDNRVNVVVTAKRYVLDSISSADIDITASLNGVTGAGEAELELKAEPKASSNKEFTIDNITPKTIKVKFGRIIAKTFPVEVDVVGMTIPDGYTMNSAIPNPLEITVSGSEEDIAQVSKAAVKIEANKEFFTTETISSQPILLYDINGAEIKNEHLKLDKTTASVKIPILKKKEVPVKIEFLNVPQGFPIDELKYKISKETLSVAGPENHIDNYNQIVVGYVDIKSLTLGSSYTFDIELPPEFVNVDNVTAITVDFDTNKMKLNKFYVSNLEIINAPPNFDVKVISNRIIVYLIGNENVLKKITADDIVATIDLSDRDIITGEYKAPVKVSVPNKGLVWANGDYNAVIRVKSKDG